MDINVFVQWIEAIKEHVISGDILILLFAVFILTSIIYLLICLTGCLRALIDGLVCFISFGKILPGQIEERGILGKLWDRIKTSKGSTIPIAEKKFIDDEKSKT